LKAKSLLAAALILAAASAGGYYWLQEEFVRAGPAAKAVRVDVEPGTSVRGVLALLHGRGALAGPRIIELYLRLHGRHLRIKAGTYEIPAAASAAAIVDLLEEGRVVLEALTVVEGSTFAQLRRELANDTDVVTTLAGKSDAEVMAAIDHPDEYPEGRFFPDTYRFAARTTDVEILKLAYASMQRVLTEVWDERAQDLPYATAYQALVLASIVEKETGLASERARIAGVFVTRLRQGIRLQSDPTVIYGLGERYDGELHTRDLTSDTPYNTYTRVGLPPTPIALPGREALRAAVRPDVTGDLYFVATGTGDGAHHFSKTLEEHNAAVKQYVTRLRHAASAAGSTPK
jgi:peptidoglycan lytic transglycosylase G